MTPDAIWVSADDEVSVVAHRMRQARIHRVRVYRGDKLAGIVTPFDFLRVAERFS